MTIDDYMVEFAKDMKTARKAKGLSQQGLAELCDVHRSAINNVEHGYTRVSVPLFVRACEVLDLRACNYIEGMDGTE